MSFVITKLKCIVVASIWTMLLQFSAISQTLAYQIPELKFKKLEDGFRVSIPQEKDVSRVAFNINRNRPFSVYEQGDFSEQVRSPTNGNFIFEVKRQLDEDDTIYVWLSVQYKNLVYRKFAEPITLKTASKKTEANSNEDQTNLLDNEKETNNEEIQTKCEPTITKVTRHSQKFEPKCRGEIIFDEDFSGASLNTELWITEVRLASEICEDEFVLYNTSNIAVSDSKLQLKATLWNDNKPGTEVRQGLLDLGDKCTELLQEYCRRQPGGAIILPPVISARISTKSHFHFKYGRIVVKAKFPDGDWLYPLLLLEPSLILINDPMPCFHARIAFSRGNRHLTNIANTEDIGSQRLSGGVILDTYSRNHEQFLVNRTSPDSFSNDFHIYETIWNEQYLIFKVDDTEYGRIRIADLNYFSEGGGHHLRGSNGPMDRQFVLTLGLAAGGHANFPERGYKKPWVNTAPKAALRFWEKREDWLKTWNDPSLKVDYVRIYAV